MAEPSKGAAAAPEVNKLLTQVRLSLASVCLFFITSRQCSVFALISLSNMCC